MNLMTRRVRVRRKLPCVFAAVALTVVASDAWAQRSGLVGGISFGGGMLDLQGPLNGDPAVALVRQNEETVSVMGFDVHLGAMVNDKTAAMFVMAGDFEPGRDSHVPVDVRVGERQVLFSSSTTSLGSGVFAGALQRWLTPSIWIRGGGGAGFLTRDFTVGTDASYLTITLDRGYGLAIVGGVGVEVWRRGNFAADVEFHFTAVGVRSVKAYAPTVQLGLNWY